MCWVSIDNMPAHKPVETACGAEEDTVSRRACAHRSRPLDYLVDAG